MEEKLEKMGEEYTNETPETIGTEKVDTTPPQSQENSLGTVTVKFNKEIKQLSTDEAAILAQKGMKYDLVSGDLVRLKTLAQNAGKNISDYLTDIENESAAARKKILLEEVGGNEELAERVIKLEKSCGERLNGFSELQKEFPEIKTQDDLPDEVLLSVSERGSNYFDEYLRYLYGQQKKIIAAKAQEQESSQTSVGSQNRYVGNGVSNTSLEFIKGLWS